MWDSCASSPRFPRISVPTGLERHDVGQHACRFSSSEDGLGQLVRALFVFLQQVPATTGRGSWLTKTRLAGRRFPPPSVDEVNAASLRILEKLGFERIATCQVLLGFAEVANSGELRFS